MQFMLCSLSYVCLCVVVADLCFVLFGLEKSPLHVSLCNDTSLSLSSVGIYSTAVGSITEAPPRSLGQVLVNAIKKIQ